AGSFATRPARIRSRGLATNRAGPCTGLASTGPGGAPGRHGHLAGARPCRVPRPVGARQWGLKTAAKGRCCKPPGLPKPGPTWPADKTGEPSYVADCAGSLGRAGPLLVSDVVDDVLGPLQGRVVRGPQRGATRKLKGRCRRRRHIAD